MDTLVRQNYISIISYLTTMIFNYMFQKLSHIENALTNVEIKSDEVCFGVECFVIKVFASKKSLFLLL